MFDISWTEFLLIGIVALIVIGPKELPGVLRTLGQYTRKVRRMAAEFQNQFQEAMREAELADLKKEVDDMAHDIKNYDPLKEVRADVETMGKDIEQSIKAEPEPKLESKPEPKSDIGAESEAKPETPAVGVTSAAVLPEPEFAVPTTPVERSDLDPAGADTPAAAAPESVAEPATPDNSGRPA
jgi:sec-independent protein translocase protein TatB